MPEVALAGQKRLKAAKVLCIGTGGLGRSADTLPGRGGRRHARTGRLRRRRRLEPPATNHPLHQRVGRPKIDSAEEKLQAINPDLVVRRHEHAVDSYQCVGDVRRLRRDRGRNR